MLKAVNNISELYGWWTTNQTQSSPNATRFYVIIIFLRQRRRRSSSRSNWLSLSLFLSLPLSLDSSVYLSREILTCKIWRTAIFQEGLSRSVTQSRSLFFPKKQTNSDLTLFFIYFSWKSTNRRTEKEETKNLKYFSNWLIILVFFFPCLNRKRSGSLANLVSLILTQFISPYFPLISFEFVNYWFNW